jgi:hypothetical protein
VCGVSGMGQGIWGFIVIVRRGRADPAWISLREIQWRRADVERPKRGA